MTVFDKISNVANYLWNVCGFFAAMVLCLMPFDKVNLHVPTWVRAILFVGSVYIIFNWYKKNIAKGKIKVDDRIP